MIVFKKQRESVSSGYESGRKAFIPNPPQDVLTILRWIGYRY